MATASRPQKVSPGPFQRAKGPTSAESQQNQQSQSSCPRQKINPPMGWTHDHSEMHSGQALSGHKRPPGPGRSPLVHFRGPKVQLSAESQQNQRSQPSCARQKIKPTMGWTHFHSKTNLEQSLTGCQQPAGTRWSLQAPLSGQRSNSQVGTNESSRLRPAAPSKSSKPLDDGPMAIPK